LSLTDLALQPYPNDPVLHEFRALCLFALGRYDEAAAALYAVLTACPGWDWATLIGLYPDAGTYTRQLRALEAAIAGNKAVASKRFVLAYVNVRDDRVEVFVPRTAALATYIDESGAPQTADQQRAGAR
jgi:hypothetical protein